MVTLPIAYELGPDGKDVYRNFVIPVPLTSNRFVRTVEFRPDSPAIHHARLLIDPLGEARKREGKEGEPGFRGTMPPGADPQGFVVAWAPGRLPSRGDDGLSWVLEPGTDLIANLHLQRTGKRERVQPKIGFYFTEMPPTNTPVIIGLDAMVLDIGPGITNYSVERSFTLPADAELLSVLPHAHYLGKEIVFTTTAPGGATATRLQIRDWDFNWQRDYRYVQPVHLIAGTRLGFRCSFDNSTNNLRNPSRPPRLVRDGLQTTDEMAQLWLQLLPRNAADRDSILRAFDESYTQESLAFFRDRLRRSPESGVAHFNLGKCLLDLGQMEEAFEHLATAEELRPNHVGTQHALGSYYFRLGKLAAARDALDRSLALDPGYFRSHLLLGLIAMAQGELDEAETHFHRVLQLIPNHAEARQRLGEVAARRKAR